MGGTYLGTLAGRLLLPCLSAMQSVRQTSKTEQSSYPAPRSPVANIQRNACSPHNTPDTASFIRPRRSRINHTRKLVGSCQPAWIPCHHHQAWEVGLFLLPTAKDFIRFRSHVRNVILWSGPRGARLQHIQAVRQCISSVLSPRPPPPIFEIDRRAAVQVAKVSQGSGKRGRMSPGS